jgi:hypothetical protein
VGGGSGETAVTGGGGEVMRLRLGADCAWVKALFFHPKVKMPKRPTKRQVAAGKS